MALPNFLVKYDPFITKISKNLILVCVILYFLNIIDVFDVDLVVNLSFVFAITMLFATASLMLWASKLSDKQFESVNIGGKYLFALLLVLITLTSLQIGRYTDIVILADVNSLLASIQIPLIICSVSLGAFLYYTTRNSQNLVIKRYLNIKTESEYLKYDFKLTHPMLNSIPIIRHALKWMYDEGWWYSGSLFSLFVISVSIRIYLIYHGNFNYDSGFTLYDAKNIGQGIIPWIDYDGRSILYHYVLYWFLSITEFSVLTSRFFNLALFITTSILMFKITRKYFTKNISYISTAMILVLPSILYIYDLQNGILLLPLSLIFIYSLLEYNSTGHYRFIMLAGFIVGISYFVRKVAFSFLVASMGFFVLMAIIQQINKGKLNIPKAIKEILSIGIPFFIVCGFVLAFYAYNSHFPHAWSEINPLSQTMYFQQNYLVQRDTLMDIFGVLFDWFIVMFFAIISFINLHKVDKLAKFNKIIGDVLYLITLVSLLLIVSKGWSLISNTSDDLVKIVNTYVPKIAIIWFMLLLMFTIYIILHLFRYQDFEFLNDSNKLLLFSIISLTFLLYSMKNKFNSEYFMDILPFAAILAADGIDKCLKLKKPMRLFVVIILIAGLLVSAFSLTHEYHRSRDLSMQDFNQVSHFIENNTKIGDIVFVYDVVYSAQTGRNNVLNLSRGYYNLNKVYKYPGYPKSMNYSSSDIIKAIVNENVEYTVYDWRMRYKLLNRNPQLRRFYLNYFNETVLEINHTESYKDNDIKILRHPTENI